MNKSAFEAKVMEILRDNSSSKWRRHMEEGRLDPRSLHKLGSSLELFRLKEIPGKKDYAVAFVVDNSGSMDKDGKREAAKQMAISFAESMNVLRIPFCVVVFGSTSLVLHKPGSYYHRPDFRKKLDMCCDGDLCAEFEGDPARLYHYRFPKLGQPERIHGVENVPYSAGGYTRRPNGSTNVLPAISMAYSQIAGFPGKKIVVTMSDGKVLDGDFYSGERSVSPDVKRALETLDSKVDQFYDWRITEKPGGRPKGIPFYVHSQTSIRETACVNLMKFMMLNRYLLDEGAVPLYMGIKDSSFLTCANEAEDKEHWFPSKNAFCVHDLSQAYDAMVSKLSENFQFDHDRKLR